MSNTDALNWFVFLFFSAVFMYFVSFYHVSSFSSFESNGRHIGGFTECSASYMKKERSSSISIALVGDIMMDRGVRSMTDIHGGGDYGFITRYLDFLNEYDIVFGNLEGPLSDKGQDLGGKYSFRMDPSALNALLDVNFSALSVANNHAGDWGKEAFHDTVLRLREAGIAVVGGGEDIVDAQRTSVIDIDGHTVGFVGFNDVGAHWMEAGADTPGILMAISDYHDDVIKKARREVDTLIVSYHFGDEYMPEPNERQRALATRAVDLGADIIAGHHPHVIQPVEILSGSVIAYSLGNFIFDQYFSKETMEGSVLVVTIENGEISFEEMIVELTDRFQPRLRIDQ